VLPTRVPAKPTLAGALAAVQTDPQAKFAALLAGVFAFSFGFALGFALAERERRSEQAVR
jgi:hydrogenase/urease accessory protein HupE